MMRHFVKKWSIMETNESAQEIADRLVENFREMGIPVKCLTDGFYVGFNGIPVLEYSTGELKEGEDIYYVARKPEIYNISMSKLRDIKMKCGVKEYAIIQKHNNIAHLCDYVGPAGRQWSGNNRDLLEKLFKKDN